MSYEDFLERRTNSIGLTSSDASPGSSQVSESQRDDAPPTHLTVDQLVQQPGRELLTVLDPRPGGNSTWFGISGNGISKSILKMLHSLLKKPYMRFSHIPIEDRNLWFQMFAQEFTWDHTITKMVEREFEKEAARQFSHNMSEWKKVWKKEKGKKQPKGLNTSVWLHFIPYWQLSTTEALSKTNSKNRRSRRGGKGMYIHNGGSTSIPSRAAQMTKERGGVPPSHLDVMEDYHTNKKTRVIQDPIIGEIIQNVKKKTTDIVNQHSQGEDSSSPYELSRQEINNLVLEEIPIRKGRRPGLGKLGITDTKTFYNSFGYNEEIIRDNEELKEKVSALETSKAATEERFAMTQDELTTTKTKLETTNTTLQNMMNYMRSKFDDCPSFQ